MPPRLALSWEEPFGCWCPRSDLAPRGSAGNRGRGHSTAQWPELQVGLEAGDEHKSSQNEADAQAWGESLHGVATATSCSPRSSAPFASGGDGVPRHFRLARKGTVARLTRSLLRPAVVVVTSKRLLRCCLLQGTVPSPPPQETRRRFVASRWAVGLRSHELPARPVPKTQWKCPIPKRCLSPGASGAVAVMQHPALLFSRLPVV